MLDNATLRIAERGPRVTAMHSTRGDAGGTPASGYVSDYRTRLPACGRRVFAVLQHASRPVGSGAHPAVSGSPVHRSKAGCHQRLAAALGIAILLCEDAPTTLVGRRHAVSQTADSIAGYPVPGRSRTADRLRCEPAAQGLDANPLRHRHAS